MSVSERATQSAPSKNAQFVYRPFHAVAAARAADACRRQFEGGMCSLSEPEQKPPRIEQMTEHKIHGTR